MKRKDPPVYRVIADMIDEQYPGVVRARLAAGLDPYEPPVEPIREVCFKYDRRAERFRPCRPGGGTISENVDAAGRVVLRVYSLVKPFDDGPSLESVMNADVDDRRQSEQVGWALSVPLSRDDAAEVVAWLRAEAARRRKRPEVD